MDETWSFSADVLLYLFSWWVVWAKLGTSVRILYFTDLAGGVCGRNLELQ